MHMLDTNICIYVLKDHSAAMRRKFRVCGDLCISVVTWAELCFGVENGTPALRESRWAQLDAFTRLLPTLPLDEDAGRHYGRLRAHLKRKGAPIGNNDLFIAAHALSTGSILVTNNEREFKRVPGLIVENWT
jgi:tRNA(fMet)-specific endonuclease VapC